MKTDIQTLKDSFKLGYETFEDSIDEAKKALDYFHNRQYTNQQLNTLADRGQPAETFNVVKLFGRMLVGYYSTVLNTAKIKPKDYSSMPTAALLDDLVDTVYRVNDFNFTGDDLKLDGALTGIMCTYVNIKETGEKDYFGRKLKEIELEAVSPLEIVLDPMSRKADYSDARFLHRWRWMTEEQVNELFGKGSTDKLVSHYNHLNVNPAEFESKFNMRFSGHYKVFDNYLIVHTVVKDDEGKTWSKYWCDTVELASYEITFKDVKFPYRIQKIHTSDIAEYYGLMREAIPAQDAINQAIIKIQLMASTQKAIVEEGAVEDIDEFTDSFNRVNSVMEVKSLNGIKIENLSKEVLDQYTIIDKALDRIQRLLGINDSFLGMAFASDSGRKVKLQQNQSIIALRYLSGKFEQFYKLLSLDIVNLIKQYYTANQAVRIADDVVGDRWIELNRPEMQWSGRMDPITQVPIMVPVMEEVLDPATQKPEIDDEGNIIVAPVPTIDTDIAFARVDIEIETAAFNDEDEKNQLMLETILSGNIGSMLSQVNPAGFFQAANLSLKNMKSRYSPEIAAIMEQTSIMLGANPQMQQAMMGGQLNGQQNTGGNNPMSQSLKLPQNTNEGL